MEAESDSCYGNSQIIMRDKTLFSIIIDFLIYLFNRKRKIVVRNNDNLRDANDNLKNDYDKIDEKYKNVKEPTDVKEISDRLNNRF
jgi:hypothetical protein